MPARLMVRHCTISSPLTRPQAIVAESHYSRAEDEVRIIAKQKNLAKTMIEIARTFQANITKKKHCFFKYHNDSARTTVPKTPSDWRAIPSKRTQYSHGLNRPEIYFFCLMMFNVFCLLFSFHPVIVLLCAKCTSSVVILLLLCSHCYQETLFYDELCKIS